jgi:hypothetical protein
MSTPFDPWPGFRFMMLAKGILFVIHLTTLRRVVPALVPNDDGKGGEGPPVLFVWHPEGENEDHGVIMKVAADGRFDVALTHGMADADLLRRLVECCVVEGVPFEVSPCEPAPEGEDGA